MTIDRKTKVPLRLLDDQAGSIAVTFALLASVLCLTVGLAVDYSRSAHVHISLQNDLDAAVLAAAATSETPEDLQVAAQQFIGNNWRSKFGVSEPVFVGIEKPSERTIRGTTSVRVPTTLMALAGVDYVDVRVATEIELAAENVELALVLDVTNSMMGAKIEALKSSAESLIDKVYENPKSAEHVRIAIVPFADHVNIGEINRDASWVDVPSDSETTSETCTNDYREVTGSSNCRMQSYTYDTDGVQVTGEHQICDHEYGPPQYRCFTNTYAERWYGCVSVARLSTRRPR